MNRNIIRKEKLILEPFLEFTPRTIYNPITDLLLKHTEPLYEEILKIFGGGELDISPIQNKLLIEKKWLIGLPH